MQSRIFSTMAAMMENCQVPKEPSLSALTASQQRGLPKDALINRGGSWSR